MKSPLDLSAPAAQAELPPIAERLGYLGAAAFIFGAFLTWVVRPELYPIVALMMSAYAAVIVSFLGAIHWGVAMRGAQMNAWPFVWGITPGLLAWIAVVMPPSAGLVLHGLLLVLCYLVDRRLYTAQGLAHWLTLRFRLTGLASFSCFMAAAAI